MSLSKNNHQLCVEIARLLREERERRELSVYAIAKKSGLTQQAIAFIENDERVPSLETALHIADAIGVKLEDVIKQARKRSSKRKAN